METVLSILVLGFGVGFAIVYLRKPAMSDGSSRQAFGGNRPWRELGAAVCLVLSIMFVAGVNLLDATSSPRLFMAYWLVMLVLVIWLCGLALKDIIHTRHAITTRRAREQDPNQKHDPSDDAPKEEKQ